MFSAAHYDPATDQIVGCEEGTYTYAHEQRHRYQHHSVVWRFLNSLAALMMMGGAALCLLAWGFYSYGMLLAAVDAWLVATAFVLFFFVVRVSEEVDAHVYAVRKWLGGGL